MMAGFRVKCEIHGMMTGELCECGMMHAKVLQAMADMEWHGVRVTVPTLTEWITDLNMCQISLALGGMVHNSCVSLDTEQPHPQWGTWRMTLKGQDALLHLLPLAGHALEDIYADHLMIREDWQAPNPEGGRNE